MGSLTAAETIRQSRRIVLKIGSALLVDDASGALREEWLGHLAQDVAAAKADGKDVVIVSSGSIALGRRVLGLEAGELPLEKAQAAASVGQIRLARAYQQALAPHGIEAGQVLVTLEDSQDRRRYLNSRETLKTLLSLGVVPIVNENDTVATDEIRFGDNDRLAAQVTSLCGADLLILLSDVEGLYTANPRTDSAANHIPVVEKLTPEIEAMADGEGSGLSRGGMLTKLAAAKVANRAGSAMIIAKGDVARPIEALLQGGTSTLFLQDGDPKAARKQWILSMKPKGSLTVDDGAARALAQGKSLLPAGVTGVSGQFHRGDPIEVRKLDGTVIARGLAEYDAAEAAKIAGHRSDQITGVLGYARRSALIHRDDMAE